MRYFFFMAGNGPLYERKSSMCGLLLALALFCPLCVCVVPASAAEGLVLRNFVLDNQQEDMTVRFSLDVTGDDNIDEMRVALLDGDTLVLDCQAELSRRRGYWLDKSLAEGQLTILLRADREAETYILTMADGEHLREGSLEEMLESAWRDLAISLGPFSILQRKQSYSVELSVMLKQYDVPAWKRWTMFFRSFAILPEARYQMDFEY